VRRLPQQELCRVKADLDRATIYAEGWQSWSATAILPLTVTPATDNSRESLVIDRQYGVAAPAGVHQGSGLLAFDPGTGGPVELFAAPDASRWVPVIQARPGGAEIVVTADRPVDHRSDAGPGGLTGALGRWADEFAARAGAGQGRLRAIAPVWCSWYQYFGDVTEADIAANLAAMDRLRLPFSIVQIDDGYEAALGDWLTPSGRFASVPGLVRRIRDTGRQAGIWIAPALVAPDSELFARHPGWVVRDRESAAPVFAGHGCTALDFTHPGAARYLADVLARMRAWGVGYFKVDFLYAGAGEGRRHDDVSGVEAYRRGLRLIRDAIGPEAILLGCGAPILPSVGLVDAMRVGPDIAARYDPPGGQSFKPSQRNATRNVVARGWQQGRFWVNDADCLLARPGVERREEWARTVADYSALRSSGDGLRELDEWGLETTRRLLVASPTAPWPGPGPAGGKASSG
jgi:alpha-galactosidase